MHPFQDSILPWLHVLAAQSVKASLLAGLVALLCLLRRRWLSSPWRHLLWCAVFVRLVLPDLPVPGWSWNINRLLPEAAVPTIQAAAPAPFDEVPPSVSLPQAEETEIPVTSSPSLPSIPITPSLQATPLSWPDILGMLWLGGALAWWCALGVGAWRFRRLMAHASEAAPRTQALLKACLAETNLRIPIQVKCPHHLTVPAVCGVLRPVILIPRSIEAALSPGDLRLLLLHELGHVQRRDTSVQVAASLLLGLHWWNPVLWFAWSRLRHESEAATDAWVLRHSDPATAPAYGAMLLDLAARACAVGFLFLLLPGLMSATSHGKHLRQRLVAITTFRRLHKRAALWGYAAMAILALTGFSENAPAPISRSEKKAEAIAPSSVGGIVVDEQGKPIPGAKIELNFSRAKNPAGKSAFPEGPLKPEFTESDAAGHWHFDGVPAAVVPETLQGAVSKDTYCLYITHPDFLLGEFSGAGTALDSDASFRKQSAKLVLMRGHMIRGMVRNEKGYGIAGATVERNVNVRHGADPKATTDANGNYTLKAARPGDFVMRARAEGFALQQQRVILTADESLDFTLKPAHTLTLKFRDAQGKPLTKGYVNLMPVQKPWLDSDRLWIGKPDQDGVVVWKEAPAGDIIAVVHMDGCERLDQEVPTDRETVLMPKATPPLPTLTIRVKSAGTGKPLPGCKFETALVMRSHPTSFLWIGDRIHAPLKPGATEGDYTAQIPKFSLDPMVFRVRCPGYAPALTTIMDPRKANTTLEISLKERAPLTITALKADGSPAANADVYVAWGNDAKPWTGDELMSTPHLMTDFTASRRDLEFSGAAGEDGRCILPACADEASVLIKGASMYATTNYGRLIQDSTLKLHAYRHDEEDLVKTILPPKAGADAFGHLHVWLMRQGKPVLEKKGVVMLQASEQTKYTAMLLPVFIQQGVAISGGHPGTTAFQMGQLSPDGSYWFSAVHTALIKADETTEVTATLEPGIRIAGHIADEVPRPVHDALIYAYVLPSEEGVPSKLLWTDRRPVREDGTFEFPSLPPGNVRFLVLADGWISPLTPTEGGKNRPWSAGRISQSRSDVVVPMQRTASCEVTVSDAEGKAVSGASVRISASFSPNRFAFGLLDFGGPRNSMVLPFTSPSLEESFAYKKSLIGDRINLFKVLTDAQGHAMIQGLPPLADLNKIGVVAPGIDPRTVHKPSGSAQVNPLKPGETAKVTLRLEEKSEELKR